MPDLLILFSIWMIFFSFDIVNFGFPQSLVNMVYDFMSFKLFSSGYKHVSITNIFQGGGGGGVWGDCSIDPIKNMKTMVDSALKQFKNDFITISRAKFKWTN